MGEYCLTVHQCILADIDPAMGKMDIQTESATFMLSYILCIGTKKPTNICIHYHLPVLFFNFFFFYKIHTNMYVFGFHKADTHTKIENQSTSHYVKTF